MPRNVPTSAAATCSPIISIGPEMDAMVMTMPSTAATMPKPGMASPVLVSTLIGAWCSISMRSISTSSRSSQLVGLDLAVDDGPEAAAEELDGLVVAGEDGVFLEDGAVLGFEHVLFQGDHAVAATEQEEFVEDLEQFLVGGAAVGRALEADQEALEDVDEHLARGHDDERAKGAAADDDQFVWMDQGHEMAASHEEAADDGQNNDDGPNDDDHDCLSNLAGPAMPSSKRCR